MRWSHKEGTEIQKPCSGGTNREIVTVDVERLPRHLAGILACILFSVSLGVMFLQNYGCI